MSRGYATNFLDFGANGAKQGQGVLSVGCGAPEVQKVSFPYPEHCPQNGLEFFEYFDEIGYRPPNLAGSCFDPNRVPLGPWVLNPSRHYSTAILRKRLLGSVLSTSKLPPSPWRSLQKGGRP